MNGLRPRAWRGRPILRAEAPPCFPKPCAASFAKPSRPDGSPTSFSRAGSSATCRTSLAKSAKQRSCARIRLSRDTRFCSLVRPVRARQALPRRSPSSLHCRSSPSDTRDSSEAISARRPRACRRSSNTSLTRPAYCSSMSSIASARKDPTPRKLVRSSASCPRFCSTWIRCLATAWSSAPPTIPKCSTAPSGAASNCGLNCRPPARPSYATGLSGPKNPSAISECRLTSLFGCFPVKPSPKLKQ